MRELGSSQTVADGFPKKQLWHGDVLSAQRAHSSWQLAARSAWTST